MVGVFDVRRVSTVEKLAFGIGSGPNPALDALPRKASGGFVAVLARVGDLGPKEVGLVTRDDHVLSVVYRLQIRAFGINAFRSVSGPSVFLANSLLKPVRNESVVLLAFVPKSDSI